MSPPNNKNRYDGQRSASIKVIGQNNNLSSNRSSLVIHNITLTGIAHGNKESERGGNANFKTVEYENYGKRTNEILD